MKRWLMMLVLACVLEDTGMTAEIRNVTAAYNWPWNVVGLRYEVGGSIPDIPLEVVAFDIDNNTKYTAEASALFGDTGGGDGIHQVIWDLEKQGVKLQSTNVVFTVNYRIKSGYIVVDLSAGENATSYPVVYLDASSSGIFNADIYKTTRLVLRRIEAGTFMMGSPYGADGDWDVKPYDGETQHQVTLTKAYYIGVFEVTQKQWELVMGSTPASYSGDMRPMESISYDMIRGIEVGKNWPASNAVDADSFLGKLRSRTGLDFDLPTEAQWEYACRAGTTSFFNNGGNTRNELVQLGRYFANADDGRGGYSEHTTVGSYLPNAWGLYDMHGNVCEWCLDWWVDDLGNAAVTDPVGPSTGAYRILRGGSRWSAKVGYCRSAYRSFGIIPSGAAPNTGLRLACLGGL